MKRFERPKRLDYRSSRHSVNEAHTLNEWADLYRQNPSAVPPHVQHTLKQRGVIRKDRH